MAGILRVDQANVDYIYAKTAGGKVYVPGHVIQVQQTVKSDVFSSSTTTFIDLTGMSVSITPTSTSSKIIVEYSVQVSIQNGAYGCLIKILRNGSDLSGALGAGGGSASTTISFSDGATYSYYPVYNHTMKYLDSPSTTSQITYKFKWADPRDSTTHYIGRSSYDADSNAVSRSLSMLTLMEIAQ